MTSNVKLLAYSHHRKAGALERLLHEGRRMRGRRLGLRRRLGRPRLPTVRAPAKQAGFGTEDPAQDTICESQCMVL